MGTTLHPIAQNLIFGDSTARRLHEKEAVIREDSAVSNLSLGGATLDDMYLVARNYLDKRQGGKALFVFAFPYSLGLQSEPGPYKAIFFRPLDFPWLFTSRLFTLKQKKKIFFHSIFPYLAEKEDSIAEGFYVFGGEYGSFVRVLQEYGRAKTGQEPRDKMHDLNKELIEEVQSFFKERNIKTIFVRSPINSAERAKQEAQGSPTFFRAICERSRLDCIDLSAAYPDNFFEEDGVHLLREHMGSYKARLEALLND